MHAKVFYAWFENMFHPTSFFTFHLIFLHILKDIDTIIAKRSSRFNAKIFQISHLLQIYTLSKCILRLQYHSKYSKMWSIIQVEENFNNKVSLTPKFASIHSYNFAFYGNHVTEINVLLCAQYFGSICLNMAQKVI